MCKLESISPEIMEELRSIHEQIVDYGHKIQELSDRADELVPKHTLEECRELGCVHTYHCQFYCLRHSQCIRSKYSHGAYTDCFEPKKKVVKLPTDYPTLGWKKVTGANTHFVWDVIKETDKTLILNDKTQLLKSTIFNVEDGVFIRDRRENVYLCADDPDATAMLKTLLDVVYKELVERNSLSHKVFTPETPLPTSTPDGVLL